jgi:hypothetical protein
LGEIHNNVFTEGPNGTLCRACAWFFVNEKILNNQLWLFSILLSCSRVAAICLNRTCVLASAWTLETSTYTTTDCIDLFVIVLGWSGQVNLDLDRIEMSQYKEAEVHYNLTMAANSPRSKLAAMLELRL